YYITAQAHRMCHTKNVKNIHVGYNLNERSPVGIELGYNHHLNKWLQLGAGMAMERGKAGDGLRFHDFYVFPEIKFSPNWSVKGIMYFNFGIGLYAGFQHQQNLVYRDESRFAFLGGFWLRPVDVEVFFHKNVGAFVSWRHHYTFGNSTVGNWHWNASAGLK